MKSPKDGHGEVHWSPRVRKNSIRRLYESDAKGVLDEELVDDVGISLFARCQDILTVDEARKGRIRCPRCRGEGRDTVFDRPRHVDGDVRDQVLRCPLCGWRTTWGQYQRTFQRRQLNLGGARAFFEGYVREYPKARTARVKMLAIDRLIHGFHFSLLQDPGRPTRPAGVNLIEGRLTDVVQFLDALSYGPHLPPEVEAQRTRWRELVNQTFLGRRQTTDQHS